MLATAPETATSLSVLHLLFGDALEREIAVRFWDGTRAGAHDGPFTLVINEPYALRALLSPPLDTSPGRTYALGWIDIEGDAEAAVDAFARATEHFGPWRVAQLMLAVSRLPAPPKFTEPRDAQLHGAAHTPERDAAAIAFHYDQPIAFYQAILDPAMVYSCAYFDDGITDLADAQRAKIDHILRKAGVRPGMRILDIGCGWGALVVRAARDWGADVLGITLSKTQHAEANRRIEAAGLGDRARVELRDYRDLRGEQFDAIVSIGMVEHVGAKLLPKYFRVAYDALVPGGRFVNHGIAEQNPGRTGGKPGGFIDKYVFPDGELTAIGETTIAAERIGFEVRDIENLREHYARTLRAWVANLERNREAVIDATDETTYRIWRLYLAGSAQGFASGRMGLFQSVLVKPTARGESGMPATRRYLYTSEGVPTGTKNGAV